MMEFRVTINFRRSPWAVASAVLVNHGVLLSPELLALLTEAERDPVAIVSDILKRSECKPMVLTIGDLKRIL